MTVLVLLLRRNLREPLSQGGNIEDMVIAKSSLPSRCLQDFPVHTPGNDRLGLPVLRECDGANEMGGALSSAALNYWGKE